MIIKDNILSRKSLHTNFEPDLAATGPASTGSKRLKKDFGVNLKSQTSQYLQPGDLLKDVDDHNKASVFTLEQANPATGYRKVILPNLRDRDR